jgi:hypothetical protein
MTQHLSHEQLCDVLLADADQGSGALDTQREHLADCLICASELHLLRGSAARFRTASIAYADRELARRSLPPRFNSIYEVRSRKYFSQPLSWAAAALAVAVALPLGLHMHRPASPPASIAASTPAPSTESDEALLEGIDQDLTTDIPSPMKPLADPTASATQAQSNDATQRKN